MRSRTGWALMLVAALAACGASPRGAGLQREVLARSSSDPGDLVTAGFAVAPVTRAMLPVYAGWPAVGETGENWIARVDQPDSRIIAAGDTVVVNLFSAEENGLLTGPNQRMARLPPARVAPDGTIFLPYVGTLRVAGMSVEHARARVQEAYAGVAASTQVQLEVSEGRASTVSVVGGAVRPGVYPLADQDVTVLEVIAAAGGAQPGLENPQVRLQRGGRLFRVSFETLLATPSLNTTLTGGDKLYLESDRRYFLSLGAAGRETQVHFPQDRLSALDALSLIGGLSDNRADAKGILILRRYPAEAVRPGGPGHMRTIFTLDLTSADGLFSAGEFRIRPNDLVYVTESPLGSASVILALVGSVFGLANTASAVANRS